MELESKYEVLGVSTFIRNHDFKRVALQFPDELRKDSTAVVRVLRKELQSSCEGANDIGLYLMADTTYGSCCVDEVGASHINADCVIHYGHTCLSATSKLPAFFVFGRSTINASNCAKHLCSYALSRKKPVMVLYGLEYGHALQDIIEASTIETTSLCGDASKCKLHFADVMSQSMFPPKVYVINGDCDDASEKRIGLGV